MHSHTLVATVIIAPALLAACAHVPVATVLPQRSGQFQVVAQSATEQGAYRKAHDEATYTCEDMQRRMVVVEQASVFQGADKNSKGDVEAGNVALAFFTGSSGKERESDDYKVTLMVECL